MRDFSPTENRGPVIAVVGGGASGTLAVLHLLRSAAAQHCPLRVVLIDRHGRHGLGQAYGTTHPEHLLNAPAAKMSALAGDPDHLIRWAAEAGIADAGFLPRHVYGRYLRDTLSDAERRAQPLSRVTQVTSDAMAIRHNARGRPLRLLLADGCIDVDIAVLAIGSLPPAPPFRAPRSHQFIADPWAPGALDNVGDGSPVIVAGTGLTMLDVAIAATSSNLDTTVHAVSRHGLLPRAHRGPAAAGTAIWLPVLSDDAGPVRLAELMWQIRASMATRQGCWPEVIDALRPHVPGLWQRMPARDKRFPAPCCPVLGSAPAPRAARRTSSGFRARPTASPGRFTRSWPTVRPSTTTITTAPGAAAPVATHRASRPPRPPAAAR